jgi:hypothetical protein
LLHLVGYLYYWQMGFNSVFKGLMIVTSKHAICILSFPGVKAETEYDHSRLGPY